MRFVRKAFLGILAGLALASAAHAVTLNGPTRGVDSLDQYNRAVAAFSTGSFADNITAHAGGTQAACQQLFNQANRVTTVASPGDSVCLPNSASQPPGISNGSLAGGSVTVINAGASPLQVFGFGTDTINGVATATGVSQMPGSAVTYYVANIVSGVGQWIAQGIGTGYSGSFPTQAYTNNATAAGTTQSNATAITTPLTVFGTVASSTGAVLPPAAPGLMFTVVNNGANTLKVYGNGSDTINGTAGSTGVSITTSTPITIFYSAASGAWFTK